MRAPATAPTPIACSTSASRTCSGQTFLSAIDITKQLLQGLGISEREAERITHTFRIHDERRLIEDYQHASDLERLQERARSDVKTLEKLFEEDAAEEARLREAAEETRV